MIFTLAHGKEEEVKGDPRIFMVVTTFHPVVGGVERQALVQARNLRERGHEVTIITFRHNKAWPVQEIIEGVPVMRVAGALLRGREKLPRLLQRSLYMVALMIMGWVLWRLRHSYDLLHVHQFSLLALPTAVVARATSKPVLFVLHSAGAPQGSTTPHKPLLIAGPLDSSASWLEVSTQTYIGGDLENLKRMGKLAVRLTRSLLASINTVVVIISSRMKDYLIEHNFSFLDTQFIANGLDIDRFHPTLVDAFDNERRRIVVCISRLSYEKGIDVLLQAWYLIQKQAPETRLIIVGTGPLQGQLEQMAQALAIVDSVEFAGLQQDIPAQLYRGSLAVSPSRWEGMPVAVLEAMACGLPCVATRVSGSEDIITHGVNGLLVEPEDYQSLAQALLVLLRDPELARQYGRAAHSTIEQRYSLEHITNQYVELYRRMVGRKHELIEDTLSAGSPVEPLKV